MGEKQQYSGLSLNKGCRSAVNKCRLFWRVCFCAPEASSHSWMSQPGWKLRAQSCFSGGSLSSLPPGVAGWGCAWRALRLLTFSSALGFNLLSTVEEALSGLFYSVSTEMCTSLFSSLWLFASLSLAEQKRYCSLVLRAACYLRKKKSPFSLVAEKVNCSNNWVYTILFKKISNKCLTL